MTTPSGAGGRPARYRPVTGDLIMLGDRTEHLAPAFAGALALGTLGASPASAKPTPTTVTIVGPFAVNSPDVEALEAEFAAFTSENRVVVEYDVYSGPAQLEDLVTGPIPPDLIISPQPGTITSLAPHLVDFGDFVNPVALRRGRYEPAFPDALGCVTG